MLHTIRMIPLILVVLSATPMAAQAPDYGGLYDKGVTYEAFMRDAKARRATWDANNARAAVPAELAARAKALTHSWRVLAVAIDACSDSAQSLPYVAKLAETTPDVISLRIVDNTVGRPAMEAFRTPDGRAATPTLIFIRDDGEIRAWVERPGALVAFIDAERKHNPDFDAVAGKTKWYEDDAGRSTLADIVTLLEKR
jgi:hypothetical protein